jgi:hypothetical protein
MAQDFLFDEHEKGKDGKIFAPTFEERCPFLGLADDPATALGFPDNRNLCYRHDPAVPLTQDRQAEYCLSGKHETCSIFLQEQLPDDALEKASIWRNWPSRLALILPLLLIIIAALLWWPAPSTNIEESIGNAAPLQNTVAAEENAQPPLSQEIVVPKATAQPTPFEPSIAIDAVNLQPVPTVKTAVNPTLTPLSETTSPDNEPAEEDVGGFLIHIYE